MRITVPDNKLAVLIPIKLAEELYAICNAIRNKTNRLVIEPAMREIAGEVMLALLASEGITILPQRANDNG